MLMSTKPFAPRRSTPVLVGSYWFRLALACGALASCQAQAPSKASDGSVGADVAAGTGDSSGATGGAGGTGGTSGGTGGVSGGTGGVSGGTGGGSGGSMAGASGGTNGGTGGSAPDGSGGASSGGAPGGTGGGVGSGGAGGGGGSGSGASGGRGEGGSAPRDGGADASDATSGGDAGRPARVLLYYFSTLDIPSVSNQLAIFKQKLEGWQYQVDQSKDPAVFTEQNLAKYAAVGMINTCFYPFGANQAGTTQSQALQKFVQAGGGLFGTHCADVTFQSVNPAPLYNQLIGGRANSDNYEGNNECRKVGEHPTTAGLPATFTYRGNLDNAAFLAADAQVVVKCTFGGGSKADTAVSWFRTEGTGRVFFTGFGKVDTDLTNATVGDAHIIAGLGWVLGR
jgi:type 1 glutamine amidotransferase